MLLVRCYYIIIVLYDYVAIILDYCIVIAFIFMKYCIVGRYSVDAWSICVGVLLIALLTREQYLAIFGQSGVPY